MIASYLLSSTLVPVFSTWLMKEGHRGEEREGLFGLSALVLRRAISALILRFRWPLVLVYLAASAGLLYDSAAAHGNRDLSRRRTLRFCASACARPPERASRRPSASCFARST